MWAGALCRKHRAVGSTRGWGAAGREVDGVLATSWPIISPWIAQNASKKPREGLVIGCSSAAASIAAAATTRVSSEPHAVLATSPTPTAPPSAQPPSPAPPAAAAPAAVSGSRPPLVSSSKFADARPEKVRPNASITWRETCGWLGIGYGSDAPQATQDVRRRCGQRAAVLSTGGRGYALSSVPAAQSLLAAHDAEKDHEALDVVEHARTRQEEHAVLLVERDRREDTSERRQSPDREDDP